MNSSYVRSCALTLGVSIAWFASIVCADPLPGRDLLKFSQRPMVATAVNDPIGVPNPNLVPADAATGSTTYGGHDEISTVYGYHGIGPNDLPVNYSGNFMADDFADKLNSPIVHVKWWGSYFNDAIIEPVNQFLISFESDQPSSATDTFSHPAQPLLNQVVTRGALAPGSGTFTEKVVRGPDPLTHESLYEYNAELHLDKPFPEKADTVYWLKIAAMVDVFQPFTVNVFDPLHPSPFSNDVVPTVWGWHNRDYTITDPLASTNVSPGEHLDGNINGTPVYHFQDDAVTGRALVDMTTSGGRLMPGVTQTAMKPTFYLDGADGPAAPATGAIGISHFSKDLAFELYTTQAPEPATWLMLVCGGIGLVAIRRQQLGN
jgi:hypothetical protein